MPFFGKIYFQDSNSPTMEHLIFFHDHTMIIIFLIVVWVLLILVNSISNKFFNRFISECQDLEAFWSILPSFILIFLSLPSMKILYLTEEWMEHSFSINIIGNQWYWSYEYSNSLMGEFDSFMEDSKLIRLLDTSNYVIVFKDYSTQLLITSQDVIHSWSMPSMGIKIDAVPGRINQANIYPQRIGIFTGQCSEICGANHSFMPITVFSKKIS